MKRVAGTRRWLAVLAGGLIGYLVLAYVVLPALWKHHEHEPGLAALPMVTRTGSGIPGDALNVGLVGSKEDVLRAMHRGTDGRPVWLGSITFDRGVGLSHDTE